MGEHRSSTPLSRDAAPCLASHRLDQETFLHKHLTTETRTDLHTPSRSESHHPPIPHHLTPSPHLQLPTATPTWTREVGVRVGGDSYYQSVLVLSTKCWRYSANADPGFHARRWVRPSGSSLSPSRRRHSLRAVHPAGCCEAAAGPIKAAVTAPGRLLQPLERGRRQQRAWAGETSTSISIFPFTGGRDKSGSADSGSAPGGGLAARGTHGSPRRGRLLRASSASLRPRPAALLAAWLGTGSAGPGARAAGLRPRRWAWRPGSPAKPEHIPAATPPSRAPQPGLQILGGAQPPLLGPRRPPPLRLGTKLLEEQSQLPGPAGETVGRGPVSGRNPTPPSPAQA